MYDFIVILPSLFLSTVIYYIRRTAYSFSSYVSLGILYCTVPTSMILYRSCVHASIYRSQIVIMLLLFCDGSAKNATAFI